jgi:hypothetical protein
MIGLWFCALLLALVATAPEVDRSIRQAPQDTTVPSDSSQAMSDVPDELLENLDLLMGLEILEFVDQFGDADISALLPEDVEADSASTTEK